MADSNTSKLELDMTLYSMTGYAHVHSPSDAPDTENTDRGQRPTLGLEIRAVNSRFLDLSFRMPDDLRGTEPALRELITQQLKRGKVEVRAWMEGKTDAGLRAPGVPELQRLLNVQNQIRAWLPDAQAMTVAEILAALGKSSPTQANDLSPALLTLAQEGLQALKASRAREGERLATMLHDRIAQLRGLADQAAPLIPELVTAQRQRFLYRWRDAMGDVPNGQPPESAQDRALTEATAYAIRIDVAEELTRLVSHLDEMTQLLRKGGELGKRLDFIIQELHREANTLGSKASSLSLTRISVEMKVLIEQMREQVQNIE